MQYLMLVLLISFETIEHLLNSRIRDEILRAVEINTKILFQNISFSILEFTLQLLIFINFILPSWISRLATYSKTFLTQQDKYWPVRANLKKSCNYFYKSIYTLIYRYFWLKIRTKNPLLFFFLISLLLKSLWFIICM